MNEPKRRIEKSQDGKWRVGTRTYNMQSLEYYWMWCSQGTEKAAMATYNGLVELDRAEAKRTQESRARVWTLVKEE